MSYSRSIVSLTVVSISFLLFRHISNVPTITVETGSVIYRGLGSKSGKLAIFYGIPYAEPPLGERRFRAPVPWVAAPNRGNAKFIVNAREKSAFCIQGPAYPDAQGGAGSEDCLHLNIYTPASAVASPDAAKLPVLVYIHGGGFTYGNPLSWPFETWVEQFPNTVIASVYYRLNIFGFMAAPSGAKNAGIDFNAGFLDQLEALRWVKKNIESFGGDNNRITIDGQSAGGASVLMHLLANGGRQDLFQQAIAQSVYRPTFTRIPETKDNFYFVVQHTGCNAPERSDKEMVACLRNKDVASLVRAAEAAYRVNFAWRYTPIVDGVVFQDTPTALIAKGKISHVPILTGATTDESFAQSADMEVEMKRWYPNLAKKDIKALNKLYPAGEFASRQDAVAAAVGETLLRCGSETLVDVMSKAGKQSYLYRFDQPNPTQASPLVHHSAENWWMFQGSNTGNNGTYALTSFKGPSEERFAKELIAYWLSFVHSGNPSPLRLSGSLDWPGWNSRKESIQMKRMVLRQSTAVEGESGSFVETESAKEVERCLTVNRMARKLQF